MPFDLSWVIAPSYAYLRQILGNILIGVKNSLVWINICHSTRSYFFHALQGVQIVAKSWLIWFFLNCTVESWNSPKLDSSSLWCIWRGVPLLIVHNVKKLSCMLLLIIIFWQAHYLKWAYLRLVNTRSTSSVHSPTAVWVTNLRVIIYTLKSLVLLSKMLRTCVDKFCARDCLLGLGMRSLERMWHSRVI